MNDLTPNLADEICVALTFCYSEDHKEALRNAAAILGATFEQFVAAAVAEMISQRFDLQLKTNPRNN
jgi:hypothetical protein